MAIPDYQALMLPLLESLADGRERPLRALAGSLAKRFGLTEVERKDGLPDAWWSEFYYRLKASSAHLKRAGLLESPSWEFVRITDRGRNLLAKKPPASNSRFFLRHAALLDPPRLRRSDRPAVGGLTGWPVGPSPASNAPLTDEIHPL